MGHSLTARTAVASDLSEIDALLGRSYPALLKDHYPPSVLVTAIPLISKAQPGLIASGTYFVVLDDAGRIVGAGGWTSVEPGTGRKGAVATGHIRHVVTDHRLVRRGVGRVLMERIFDSARDAGMVRLDCLSTLMAVPFYTACGFEEAGPISVELRAGIQFPAVLMHRSL